MNKKFTLSMALILSALAAFAQPGNYVFSVQNNVPYVNLVSPTILTTLDWDDFDADIPLGFNFTCLNTTTPTLYIRQAEENYGAELQLSTTTSATTFNMFGWFVDVVDRHDLDSSLPPSFVGYKTEIESGKKVTKVEWHNAGILEATTFSDSANVQAWIYENNNAVEFRFGPSSRASITSIMNDSTSYGLKGPLFYFMKGFDPNAGSFDQMYFVSNETLQQMDSVDGASFTANPAAVGVDSFPKTNVLYRWAPATGSGFNDVHINENVRIFPSLIQRDFYVSLKENKNYQLRIFTVDGKQVFTTAVQNKESKYDFGWLQAGNYILSINDHQSMWSYQITKQ